MSKFLTPPVWYDKNGNLNEMLAGTSGDSTGIAIGKFASVNGEYGVAFGINAKVGGGYSVAIGESAGTLASAIGGIAIGKGAKANGGDSIAIGEDAKGEVVYGIAIGSGAKANADSTDGIAIGRGATSEQGGIAIGGGAYANVNQIQLGNNDTAYTLNIGNGRMSLNIGSTAQGNWISATSDGISQGLYLVRYGGGSYMDLVYLMAPITITDISSGSTYTNDWYFPFYTSPYRLTINNPSNPNNPSHPIVCSCYYLKVDKTSSASNLKITPGYYKNDGDNLTPVFQSMSDGYSVFLFKIL